ncbi:Aldo/keto reductase [Rhizopogon vinicolor AM-OR11-026]|uniref:Aldo/keto reductase n=1 Tax=Rhizopogon vinicolor AM-OR11-026 TaxID=1314800 RepID=A0A1B7N8W9_9AGAM|nr:Aldo/keto reductase [Rhizopogon vinicolor AM-OR11-026]
MSATINPTSALKIVMGAMTFGIEGAEGARVHELKDVETILDIFQSHGHNEIDTARIYAFGTSEEYLGKLNWQNRGLIMDTKHYPHSTMGRAVKEGELCDHSPEGLRQNLMISLKALNTDKVDMWYLHGPDRTIPYEVTLKAVNDLFTEGYFKAFGISNYMSWEVAQMVEICKANGYIQPTVYQGVYNAIQRTTEPELFPCLRKYGISFYAFSPLAGGFFTGRYLSQDDQAEAGGRFDPDRVQGKHHRNRYWNDTYFSAVNSVREVAKAHDLTVPEVALRWISHHSRLSRETGDAVIIGASSVNHTERNLLDLEKGPLPDEVVKILDDAWLSVKAISTNYFH